MVVGVARVFKLRLIEVQGNPGTPPRTLPPGFRIIYALRNAQGQESTILIRPPSMTAA